MSTLNISSKALLVNLSISQWAGRKFDKKATATVKANHAASEKSGNYTKKLLPGSSELKEVTTAAAAMRQFFYNQTLPWCNDGARILASKNYLDFTADIAKQKDEYSRTVENFLVSYPFLINNAKTELGDLYNQSDYPNVNQLRNKFSVDVSFLPVPDISDFRVEILDSEKDEFLKRMHKVEKDALKDCYMRLHDVIKKAVEKLADPKAVYRNSLIENIQGVCEILPKLNFNDDVELDSLCKQVTGIVENISAEKCCDDATQRHKASTDLNTVLNDMSAIMG